MKREDLLVAEICCYQLVTTIECNEVMTVSSNSISFSLLVAQSIIRTSHYVISFSFVYFPIQISPRFCFCSGILR